MVSELDKSVGRIINTLSKNKMLEKSVILFTSINGAANGGDETNYGSNFPLRGVLFIFLLYNNNDNDNSNYKFYNNFLFIIFNFLYIGKIFTI